jgi:predicted Zn-dependent protease
MRKSIRFRRPVLVILLLTTCGFAVGCASDRAVIGQANQVHGSLDPAVINDPELANYFQQVGDRVIDVAKELDQQHYGPKSHFSEKDDWMFSNKMKFHLVNSKTLNAFTTGGEHMYVYNELFLECKSEDELAAVMSHEYGHVYARTRSQGDEPAAGGARICRRRGRRGAAVAGEDNRSTGACHRRGRRIARGAVRQHGLHARRRSGGRQARLQVLHASPAGTRTSSATSSST